ncbi:hypothetical protein MBSD_n1218 [Mizugakiibacter sediminis]|uniref:Transmembrane anti-sigma factor n=1 Tax=Mizugakiibacter sediminis TaxID=1475481 RepID=A0A0K8QMG7_9GAMM|nr:DUF3379 family protein [Mizugakiibacter sediminis]GAP65916.1 hypothetical protein MBSD_n1218 [Mizugakiibacter sediminis]
MECLEFRRRLGAEPQTREPAFLAHRDACPACAEAWQRAQRFERRLEDALAVAVPEGLVDRVLLAQATGERRARQRRVLGFALAASLLVALAAGFVGFAWMRHDPLPALAVAHLAEEPQAFVATTAAPAERVRADFAVRGVNLRAVPTGITYVNDCRVGAYRTVHMVMRMDAEPVVVFYVANRRTPHMREFRQGSWQGRELPLAGGTLLMLASDAQPFPAVEHAWRDALEGPAATALGSF